MSTTEQILSKATAKIATDITSLGTRRSNAISAFRQTADELASINQGLNQALGSLETLQNFITEQTGITNQMISDNDNVRAKILDIIGE